MNIPKGHARIVEAPSMLWHLRRDGETRTLCGEAAEDWPFVLHWQTQTSITCGVCLFALGVLPDEALAATGGQQVTGDPYPKAAQLARGPRKYRRTVASAKDWQRIAADKLGPCRVCGGDSLIQLHHVVARSDGGDDVADNIVSLCADCHGAITRRNPRLAAIMLERLTDAEYAYAVERGGEAYFERHYGLVYTR